MFEISRYYCFGLIDSRQPMQLSFVGKCGKFFTQMTSDMKSNKHYVALFFEQSYNEQTLITKPAKLEFRL